MATLPNICKMPGPPAPFVPAPLPNIGTSDNSPKGYSTSVTMDGDPVAIQGASFLSKGDVASQGTGGGLISSNVQGPTTFIGPGSFDTQVEGKNVQFLGDPMRNNCGPSGSPPNAATMAGVLHGPVIVEATGLGVLPELQHICDVKCVCQKAGSRGEAGQACISETLYVEDRLSQGLSPIKPEVSYDMDPADGGLPKPLMWNYPFKYPIAGTRRPDAIIVDNPGAPWRGDNIKAVVEVKLGDDPTTGPKFISQVKSYERIAGSKDKVLVVDEESCTCDDDDDDRHKVPVAKKQEEKEPERKTSLIEAAEVLAGAAVVAGVVAAVVTAPAWAPVVLGGAAAAAAAAAVFGLFTSGGGSGSGGGA
jgi:Domain of unknown function (DUF4150)